MWSRKRENWRELEAVLAHQTTTVFLHQINAMEVWYQAHRASALLSFLNANPQRETLNQSPDLTGLDFSDVTVFDGSKGMIETQRLFSRIESAGVQIVGDETYPDLWKRAAELKSQYRRISLADCFGVALANELKAPFWTSDRHELTALADAGVVDIHFIR